MHISRYLLLAGLLLAAGCTAYVETDPPRTTTIVEKPSTTIVETQPPARDQVDVDVTPRTAERPPAVDIDVNRN